MARQFDVIVRAAGGVVWRERKQLELLVVHRPAYDDWTFPKGKRDRTDANLTATARREVLEDARAGALAEQPRSGRMDQDRVSVALGAVRS